MCERSCTSSGCEPTPRPVDITLVGAGAGVPAAPDIRCTARLRTWPRPARLAVLHEPKPPADAGGDPRFGGDPLDAAPADSLGFTAPAATRRSRASASATTSCPVGRSPSSPASRVSSRATARRISPTCAPPSRRRSPASSVQAAPDPATPGPYRDTAAVRGAGRPHDAASVDCVTLMADYVHGAFGRFPATVPPIFVMMVLRAHQLDTDYYDRHFAAGGYLRTHAEHARNWPAD